ncbi:MAG: hypothetical protein MK141_14265 [Pseudoxanthomonas sp.]|jgi:hypothetical protein|uniref:hypothetical protein n=1 Tax=Pseudoxanthomonas sp. TaxID=1871049 RepID=UPI0025870863|nr:hypothetical protein [Pseudoxanthomonas sp.]MCH2092724.1 hypothetical protein [Pseudoxanthomonas sp.]
MEIRLDVREVEALRVLWQRAPQIVGEELYRAAVESDLYFKGELQQQLPRGAGGLSGGAGLVGSIFTEEQLLADNVIGITASALPHAEYVEVGTRPHFPPLQPLEDWVQAKLGITEDSERRSVAFLIARKISRVGTKGDGTWARVAEAGEPEVMRRYAEGVDRVLDRLGAPA